VFGSTLVTLTLVLTLFSPQLLEAEPAVAADGSQFRAGNIISDATFFQSNALTADQVQAFLAGKEQHCTAANGQPCLKDFRASTPSLAATAYCGAYGGQASESAAQIIRRVGEACGISQQVLIVLLEKEQGIVSSGAPTSRMYRSATGYGCPDTADCDTQYYGFFNQVYNAAHQFQRYTKTSSNWRYKPGWNDIQWHPDTACGSGRVWIENQATANLYNYTPYQPNLAAVLNLYGTGDACSSYGNRNFWRIFTDWFGDPSGGGLRNPSFEGGSVAGWGASNGFINQAVYQDPNTAPDGSWFLAMNTPVSGRAMTQDVQRNTAVGEMVTASVWLRSESGAPFSGSVALWGLGGSQNEMAQTRYTVGAEWTQVAVKLPLRASAQSLLRLDIYMATTTGSVWMDNAAMGFSTAPPIQNTLVHPSFEGSFDRWTPGNGFVNQQIYADANTAKHGTWFAASNTPASGRSFAQTVAAAPKQGDRYTFSIWLRSEQAGSAFAGQVALWGLGGARPIVAVSQFEVGTTWTKVTSTLDVSLTGISQLKAEVYLGSTGNTLWLDQAMLSRNLLTASSFEGGDFTGWAAGNGFINHAVYPGAAAHGGWYLATNTATAGRSLAQSISRETSVGDVFVAEIWVRSENSGIAYDGTLALWALGGQTEVSSRPFTADGTWQRVLVELPIVHDGHSTLKFEVYLGTTGSTLQVDAGQVY
jgi:hypothetical protein